MTRIRCVERPGGSIVQDYEDRLPEGRVIPSVRKPEPHDMTRPGDVEHETLRIPPQRLRIPDCPGDVPYWQPGMTLRDWFAGQALQGMLAHATRYKPRAGASLNWHEAVSEEAYQIADAMLTACQETDQ